MRRALATLLLALFSLPLILPILRADGVSNLPFCCRREGKHRCSMETASAEQGSQALRAVQPKCSNYPPVIAVPGGENVALLKNSFSISASLLKFPTVESLTEAQYRVAFSRSRQKRGPPALLS